LRQSPVLDLGGALQADELGSYEHQMEKRTVKHYAGPNVSMKETSICVVNDAGNICRAHKVPNHPAADLARVLTDTAWHLARVSIKARSLVTMAFQRDGRGWLAGDLHRALHRLR
jgi:hypothetical protein